MCGKKSHNNIPSALYMGCSTVILQHWVHQVETHSHFYFHNSYTMPLYRLILHILISAPSHMAFCHFSPLRSLRFLFLTCISNYLSDIFPITSVVLNTGCQWSLHILIDHATCSREQCTMLDFLFTVVYLNSIIYNIIQWTLKFLLVSSKTF